MQSLKAIFLCILASTLVQADESQIPEPFRGAQTGSPVEINYEDWSYILRNTVIGAPRSNRGKALRGTQGAPTGTRITGRNKSDTRNEGNRINLKILAKDINVVDVTKIRQSLERVPSQAPMKHWRKDEQLAYWLNLYNITLVEQLAKNYPLRKIKKLKTGKNNLWSQKILNVAGVTLSLNDIQHTILPNKWDTTLFIYGLFQGYIGGPSIQKLAFTGGNVNQLLRRSAREFVNSNRGMKTRGKTLKISEYYKENSALFPDWQNDIKEHIASLAVESMKLAIQGASRVKTHRMDYFTADLFGGGRVDFIAQSNNPAALIFANSGSVDSGGYNGDSAAISIIAVKNRNVANPALDRLPAEAREYLTNMQRLNAQRDGEVLIEPVKTETKKEGSKK